jgi:hypothetical protein
VTQPGEGGRMTQTIHDLLNELAGWQRNASIGDNGERAHFDLSLSSRDTEKWESHAYSFYDGSGAGTGDTPEEALAACLTDLRGADSRAAAAERESAVSAREPCRPWTHRHVPVRRLAWIGLGTGARRWVAARPRPTTETACATSTLTT